MSGCSLFILGERTYCSESKTLAADLSQKVHHRFDWIYFHQQKKNTFILYRLTLICALLWNSARERKKEHNKTMAKVFSVCLLNWTLFNISVATATGDSNAMRSHCNSSHYVTLSVCQLFVLCLLNGCWLVITCNIYKSWANNRAFWRIFQKKKETTKRKNNKNNGKKVYFKLATCEVAYFNVNVLFCFSSVFFFALNSLLCIQNLF